MSLWERFWGSGKTPAQRRDQEGSQSRTGSSVGAATLESNLQVVAERQRQEARSLEARISQLKGEIQKLHQTWKRQKEAKSFAVQVLATGQTGGCERQFLDGVSKLLSGHRICLQVENYREDSGCFLLVFCPIASQIGVDIRNALEKLGSVPKALLVVLHYKRKDNSRFVADTTMQAKHPAVVQTIHARYTIQEGFYDCRMNEEAVATAAKVIKDLSREG